MIDEFHGRSAVGGVHIHLRGIQRAQRRTHALGDVGRVFDAFAARLQLLILPGCGSIRLMRSMDSRR